MRAQLPGLIAACVFWLFCMAPFWIGMAGRPMYASMFSWVRWVTFVVAAIFVLLAFCK